MKSVKDKIIKSVVTHVKDDIWMQCVTSYNVETQIKKELNDTIDEMISNQIKRLCRQEVDRYVYLSGDFKLKDYH